MRPIRIKLSWTKRGSFGKIIGDETQSFQEEPLTTIAHVCEIIQSLLGAQANQLARSTGFTQRESKLTGSAFAQTMVFSPLGQPAVTYPQLCQGAIHAGVSISQQGLEQRFTPQAADFLQQLLEQAVSQVLLGQSTAIPIFQRFSGVVLRDSSVISLPDELSDQWPGVGGSAGDTSSLKLQVKLDEMTGQVGGPILQAGRAHDQSSPFQVEELPAGTLRIADLGFFNLDQFAADQKQHVYWISRYKIGTYLYEEQGHRLDLFDYLHGLTTVQAELPVQLGARTHLKARLLIQRVPQEVADQRRFRLKEKARKKQQAVSAEAWALAEWTLILTNVPPELLSLREALVIVGVRWQIECLFRVWKGQFRIDEWRSTNPYRILCELFAKLIGVVMFQWCVQLHLWSLPNHSLWKAAGVIHTFATSLAITFSDTIAFERVVDRIQSSFEQICYLTSRHKVPNAAQCVLALTGEP